MCFCFSFYFLFVQYYNTIVISGFPKDPLLMKLRLLIAVSWLEIYIEFLYHVFYFRKISECHFEKVIDAERNIISTWCCTVYANWNISCTWSKEIQDTKILNLWKPIINMSTDILLYNRRHERIPLSFFFFFLYSCCTKKETGSFWGVYCGEVCIKSPFSQHSNQIIHWNYISNSTLFTLTEIP